MSAARARETEVASGTAETATPGGLSARALKSIVDDLFAPNPLFYWADLLLSTAATYAAVAVYVLAPAWSFAQLLAFVVAGFGLFRIATFMHEIVHLRKNEMRGFKLAWNVLVGIPLLTPSLFYTSHADHHSNRYYGTPRDGEYLPFGRMRRTEIVRFVMSIPLVPVLAAARALVLVPLSLVVPPLRRWLLKCASAAVISPTYRRRHVPRAGDALWLAADVACFAYAAVIAGLAAAGAIALVTIGKLYALVVFSLVINWCRTLAAHRYGNDGTETSHADQVLDSINIEGPALWTELVYPVGLRYHALHHLLPSLPYHALGTAHRRLLSRLPQDSPYRACSSNGTWPALARLWRDAGASGPAAIEIRRAWRGA